MRSLGTRRLRSALTTLILVLVVGTAAYAAGAGDAPTTYTAKGGTYTGVRPTAVGLPQLNTTGTMGAGEIVKALRDYHDSGQYDKDLETVDSAARTYLDQRLASWPRKSKTKPAIVLD